jgi:signal peptidase I
MSDESSRSRIPWLAMSLTMCCPGLGQLYCGRAARGLILFGSFALFGPLVVGMSFVATSTASLFLFVGCLLMYLGAAVWAAVDARHIAQTLSGQDYTLRDYNHLAVYVLLSLTSVPYSIGLAFFLRANVMEAFRIPSSSMSPTLLPGDRMLTNKLGISTRTFQRGDVIVFRNPENRRQHFVKRIAGLPGDSVEIKAGELLINGETLHQGSEGDNAAQGQPSSLSVQTVPAGSYFVLGDNRNLSRDSRNFGFLSHGEITGVVTYLYWPANSWSRFGSVK